MKPIALISLPLLLGLLGCADQEIDLHDDFAAEVSAATISLGSTEMVHFAANDFGRRSTSRKVKLEKGAILRVRTVLFGGAVQSHLFGGGEVVRRRSVESWYSTTETTWEIPATGTYSIYSNVYFNEVDEEETAEIYVNCTGPGCPDPMECPAKEDFDFCMENATDFFDPENLTCFEGSSDHRRDCLEATMEAVSEGGMDAFIFPCDEGEVPTCNEDGYFEWVWDEVEDACAEYAKSF